MGNVAGIGRK